MFLHLSFDLSFFITEICRSLSSFYFEGLPQSRELGSKDGGLLQPPGRPPSGSDPVPMFCRREAVLGHTVQVSQGETVRRTAEARPGGGWRRDELTPAPPRWPVEPGGWTADTETAGRCLRSRRFNDKSCFK